jgi:hypothetical protein
MARAPWQAPLRLAAVVAGVVMPMFTVGMVHANLPGGLPDPPNPPIAGLPQPGQPITLIVAPPSLWISSVPVNPNGCAIDMSYDNTQASPPGTIFRGQSACGSQVYEPIIRGRASLIDVFGNEVADGPHFAARGDGPDTSQGSYLASTGGGIPAPSTYGAGPVPGLDYTISYTTSITLIWPQYWGEAPSGCSLTGQTVTCTAQTTYDYIPGTKGGITPG